MTNKYGNIQQLINLWNTYEQFHTNLDYIDFGKWLASSHRLSEGSDRYSEKAKKSKGKGVDQENYLDARQQFFSILSRLSRLQEFYTKKFFDGLPLNNLLEFNFLFLINKKPLLRKKEIIDYHHVEYTTGIDILKRLIKLQLITESMDPLDKRSKRLKITNEGKKVLMEALIRYNEITQIFFEVLPSVDWDDCLKQLLILEEFHSKIYQKNASSTGYEILSTLQTAVDEGKS